MSLAIRPARDEDLPAITAIYAHHVRTGTASFETEPPDEDEMRGRLEAVRGMGLPYLVAEREGRVAGYAYASLYRVRPAYRFTLEDSVYVDPGCVRAGVGRELLAHLIVACEAAGARQLVAVIGGSDNEGSIRLHAGQGFETAGILRAAGWKHGRWIDSVLMQRALGPGSTSPP
jgi:phosphinothricin acetyltransferase